MGIKWAKIIEYRDEGIEESMKQACISVGHIATMIILHIPAESANTLQIKHGFLTNFFKTKPKKTSRN